MLPPAQTVSWNVWATEMRVRTLHWLRRTSPLQRIGMLIGISILLVFVVAIASDPRGKSSASGAIGHVPMPSAVTRMAAELSHTYLESRTDLPVITVVPRQKMANLRELVGSVHRYCPRCPIIVYSFELSPEQTEEIRKWHHVHLNDVRRDLFSQIGVDQSFNVVQSAIIHSLQFRDRVLYLSVDCSVSGSLEKLDALLLEKGHLFVSPNTTPDSTTLGDDSVTKRIQGYTRMSRAYTEVALPLSEYPCSHLVSGPCLTGGIIRLPSTSMSRFAPLQLASTPIVFQHLEDSTLRMRFRSESNTNADQNDIALTSKPFHTELETFANSHFAFVRFDISSISGHIRSAHLQLYPVWIQNPANPSEPPVGEASVCLVFESQWDERGIKWNDIPNCAEETAPLRVEAGAPVRVDVARSVQALLSDSNGTHRSKLASFMIRSTKGIWIKYHSRFSSKSDLHPRLNVVVSGQGSNSRFIKSASLSSQDDHDASTALIEYESSEN